MTTNLTLDSHTNESNSAAKRIARLFVGGTVAAVTTIGALGAAPVVALEPINIIATCIGNDCPPPPDPEPQVNPAIGPLPGDLTNCMPTDEDADPCDNEPEVDPEVNPDLGELPDDLTNCMPTDEDADPCDGGPGEEEPGDGSGDGGGIDDPVPGNPDFTG